MKILNLDGWTNLLTKMGIMGRDARVSTTVATPPVFTRDDFDALYHGNDLANRICNLPAEEMIRNWIRFKQEEVPAADGAQDPAGQNTAAQMATAPNQDALDLGMMDKPGFNRPDSSAPANQPPPEGSDAPVAGADGGDVGRDMLQALDGLQAQARLVEAISWARLYGGAIVFMGIDDGRKVDQPVDLDKIQGLRFLSVLDRHEVRIASTFADPLQPNFGQPELYEIVTVWNTAQDAAPVEARVGQRIHASRCLRFEGSPTSRMRRRAVNNGWADSVFVKIFEVLRGYGTTWASAEILMKDFSQAVIKMKGLADAMATHGEDAVMRRMELMDTSRSVLRAMLLDAEFEDFERKPTPLTGLPDLLDRWLARVSAAAEIPICLLFGMSPGGLQSTGDSDIRFFYDMIKSKQEKQLRPELEKLLTILLRAKEGPTQGVEPEVWSFEFNPLWQLSAGEEATRRKTVADTDKIYWDMGVVTEAELAVSRFGGDEYSAETVLDSTPREIIQRAQEADAKAHEAALALKTAVPGAKPGQPPKPPPKGSPVA